MHDDHLMIILTNKRLKTSWLGQIKSWNKIKGSTTSARRASRSTAFARFSPSEDSFSKICTTSDFKISTISYVLISTLSEALFRQMRIKICYGHQTNILLTILPLDHPHNHGKHLYAPHSDCHLSSHRASDLSSFIMAKLHFTGTERSNIINHWRNNQIEENINLIK